jgi:hypothetical protein
MALKMFYLLVYPMAVAGALTVATGWRELVVACGRRWPVFHGRGAVWLAWGTAVALAFVVGRPYVREASARQQPSQVARVTTQPLYEAGKWARAHVPAACVEYLVSDGYAAYWLHLAVLGNRRMSPRTGDSRTFVLRDALVRWLTPGALPHAIAELDAVPRSVREEFEVVADFGPAAVVKRRGTSDGRCEDGSASRDPSRPAAGR